MLKSEKCKNHSNQVKITLKTSENHSKEIIPKRNLEIIPKSYGNHFWKSFQKLWKSFQKE